MQSKNINHKYRNIRISDQTENKLNLYHNKIA